MLSRAVFWTGWIDRAFLRTLSLGDGARRRQQDPTERLATLAELQAETHREEWRDPTAYFPQVRPVQPQQNALESRWGGEVMDWSWDSDYAPIHSEIADWYGSFARNARVQVRAFRGAGQRPALIVLHGYGGGQHWLETLVFPVRRWVKRGWDVFLFALPFHGPRRASGDRLRFPSRVPLVTIEGFRQAVADLRNLVHHLRGTGTRRVGVVGMSLGGYTASLLATAEAELDLVAPFIPLGSLPLYMRDHGRFGGTEAQQTQQQQALEGVLSGVSPMWRPSLVPAERMVVGGAHFDGVTRMHHAERLAAHFGCPLVTIKGAHLMQLGRRAYWHELEAVFEGA